MTRKHPSQAKIKELLHYDPLTGKWIWRSRTPDMFTSTVRGGRGEVSAETNCMMWNNQWAGKSAGGRDTKGYWVIRIGEHQYKAHILAAIYMTGQQPEMMDHKNRVRSDNRWENLRPAKRSENNANVGARPSNKLGIKGVRLKHNKYQARLSFDRRCHYLGSFETMEEAQAAVAGAATRLHGEFKNED